MASEEARDWRENKSLLQRQRFMLEGLYGCDVTFIVGYDKTETIVAHRFILVCGSAVFESLLWKLKTTDEPIILDEVDIEAFKEMLKYLYCEDVKLTQENVLSILSLSKKYQISQLTQKCIKLLQESITINSVCQILDAVVDLQEPTIIDFCMTFICLNAKSVLKSSLFTTISRNVLKKVIGCDDLLGVSEVEIFSAAVRWAGAQCRRKSKCVSDSSMRDELGDALYLIRFPLMSQQEFALATQNSTLLSSSERLEIYDHLAAGAGRKISFPTAKRGGLDETVGNVSDRDVPITPSGCQSVIVKESLPDKCSQVGKSQQNKLPFSFPNEQHGEVSAAASPRPDEFIINRIKDTSTAKISRSRSADHCLTFSSSKSLTLRGIGLFDCVSNPTRAQVILKKPCPINKEVLVHSHQIQLAAGTKEPKLIRFPGSGIEITKGELYTFTTFIFGRCYVGSGAEKTVQSKEHDVKITFNENIEDSKTSGQYPYLIFKKT